MARPAGSSSAIPGVSFHEAAHRLAGQKGITLGQASTALGGRRSAITSTIAPPSTGISAPAVPMGRPFRAGKL